MTAVGVGRLVEIGATSEKNKIKSINECILAGEDPKNRLHHSELNYSQAGAKESLPP